MSRDDLDRTNSDDEVAAGIAALQDLEIQGSDSEEDAEARKRAMNKPMPYVRELNNLKDVYGRINELCERFPSGEGLELRHAPELIGLSVALHDAWMNRLRSLTATAMSTFAMIMFGFQDRENQEGMDYGCVTKAYTDYIKPVILLQQRIAILIGQGEGRLDARVLDELKDMFSNRLMLVKHVIVRMKHHIESLRECHSLARAAAITELGQLGDPVDRSFLEQNLDRMDPIHHLIVYIANRLKAHQFKRFGEQCYEQVYVASKVRVLDEAGNVVRSMHKRMPTRYWRPRCSLEEFINRQCDKETNFDYWKTLTGSRDMTRRLVDHFCCPGGGEAEFPELKVNRHWFAFADGIYDCHDQVFYAYDEAHLLPQEHNVSWACINLFENVHFNTAITDDSVDSLDKILEIPTPVFDSIFTHQKMDRDVIKWIYVFFGRMFYALHMFDKWQVVAFLKGVAGTGKSTLGNLLLRIFPQEFVGNLSSNSEKQFGLETLADRLIWICLEVKANFQLPLNDLQSMISGELVQVAQKFKIARTIKWGSPGMMFGNEVPPWKDIAGALMRRFVLFMFEQKVDEANVNSGLLEELCAELGTIIPKVTMVYRMVALEGGSKDVWHFLPEYFKLTRRKFLTSTSPIATFLDETTQFEKTPTGYVKLQEFANHFTEWMKQNRPADRILNVTPDHYSTPFQHHGLSVKRVSRMWEGQMITADFISGLSMVGHVY
jgi:hypothetical protein